MNSSHPRDRVYLSPPHMSGEEEGLLADAFASNWIAPLGPHVDAFEEEFASVVGADHAVAVSSGTAALHLALRLVGVEAGDEVIVPTFTFVASANPVLYLGAKPVFVDSEVDSWNLDPDLLEEVLADRARRNALPAAVIVVHLYGQAADLDRIGAICSEYGVPVVEDAAEALGAEYRGESPGTRGVFGAFSFNGNKIITTSGGGMLVTDDHDLAQRARHLATQARDPAPHYEHSVAGYNYRLSNLLAAVGRGQLRVLEDRVEARRTNFDYYRDHLSEFPGVKFQPEARWRRHTRWLTCATIDEVSFGADHEAVIRALEAENIEARPLWKPMHMQPLFSTCDIHGGAVSKSLFRTGLCLPSGSSLKRVDQDRVIEIFRAVGCAT